MNKAFTYQHPYCPEYHPAVLYDVVAVDGAILRPWRDKAKIDPDHLRGLNGTGPDGTGRQRSRQKTFRPTTSRCCKVGRKVAKRRMSCDVKVLEVVRQFSDLRRAKLRYNRPRKIKPSKISARLSTKIGKCSAAFPKYFEKCCLYREQYYKNMKKCKKRPKGERRKCRQSIRRRYTDSVQSKKQKKKKS
ncbi:hypothetical protein BaRGS_00007758 [Batillaria attramentaria]|uniref:Uncharacterized protein n=1 Tax=Batillaria attramentaria TaxID=370345 RepID=A0ABD0LNS9_9CAEN|nr:hypothetical protein BaRGS_023185 [Batillaria attramentaria]